MHTSLTTAARGLALAAALAAGIAQMARADQIVNITGFGSMGGGRQHLQLPGRAGHAGLAVQPRAARSRCG